MQTGTFTDVEYDVNHSTERRLCDTEPTLYVTVTRRTVTTRREADGTKVTTETPWENVAHWHYQHPKAETTS